jgi:hypothetical protein
MLKSTDNTDPSALSWYTTPKGSRIAMVDTQGDNSGGAIIGWVIIAGSAGFVVDPSQFNIDYTHLSADPNVGKGAGGYVYVPGVPVAIWQ